MVLIFELSNQRNSISYLSCTKKSTQLQLYLVLAATLYSDIDSTVQDKNNTEAAHFLLNLYVCNLSQQITDVSTD